MGRTSSGKLFLYESINAETMTTVTTDIPLIFNIKNRLNVIHMCCNAYAHLSVILVVGPVYIYIYILGF